MHSDSRQMTMLRWSLAGALSIVASRSEPVQTAKILADALGQATDAKRRWSFWTGDLGSAGGFLASALSEAASRMEPAEAARICGVAVNALIDALGNETNAYVRSSLASALLQVAARMEPSEAARICGQAANILAEKLGREKNILCTSVFGIWVGRIGESDGTERRVHDAHRGTQP